MNIRCDDRGQSVVIGSLLIFTILVLSFSAYQGFVVPNENAQVEADHFQDVEGQFSDFRSSVINSIGGEETRSTGFKLGTRFPSRSVALNPPPAAGRLETTDPDDVDIRAPGPPENVCDADGNPTTRTLVYTPGYNEYQPPRAISYEHRVVTREFSDGNLTDQRLVDGTENRVSLYLLTGAVSQNGISSYTLEVKGSHQHTTTLTDPMIVVPSRYPADAWNANILDDQSNVNADQQGDRVRLSFDGEWEVSCAVVGLNGDPAFTPPSLGSQSPNQKDVRLNGVTSLNGSQVDVEFENLDSSDVNAIEARINHYNHSGTAPTEADISEAGAPRDSATLEVEGAFETLDPAITFAGGTTTEVSLDFHEGLNTEDWFVLTLEYDNGDVGEYFISIRDPAGGSTATPTATTTPTSTQVSTPTPDCQAPHPPGGPPDRC